jgi:DNA repair protein RecN (Recombination protein N)
MLQALSIRDFIIVEQLDLEFDAGFTALTGETGAGKSILIDALSLSLGARNDGAVTRAGSEKADISTTFAIAHNKLAQQWLAEHEVDADEHLILRRVIYADGRSRGFINGTSATVAQLKELGELLIDIYSQNAHHSLLKNSTQREILDAYAQAEALAGQVAECYQQWRKLHQQRLAAETNAEAYAEELAELRDKTREIKQLAFEAEDWLTLQQEHSRLSHGASLLQGVESCLALLSEAEPNAGAMVEQVQHQLSQLMDFDAALQEALSTVESAAIQLEEASRFLNRYLQRTELDPARLAEVEARIQSIHALSRKYRIKPEELPMELEACVARMQVLEGAVDDGMLKQQEAQAWQAYQQYAQTLTAKRTQAAQTLTASITEQMQRLSLKGGQFQVALLPGEPTVYGLEQIEFLVAGHAGVTPRALAKVASGGELSRISLALHVTTASSGTVPCMIFDEVDVGIGGGVAEVVGTLLKQLGDARQVLVITHLPQVAAQAQHHLQVSKTQHAGTTLSHIRRLATEERVDEVARMLGGLHITEITRQHAKEMLAK